MMKQDTIEYYRRRERAEREAARTAACEEARSAHEEMASAYAQLVTVEELEATGALAPDKVINLSEALRERLDAGHRRTGLPSLDPNPSSALRA
jgi:hypothetical protein